MKLNKNEILATDAIKQGISIPDYLYNDMLGEDDAFTMNLFPFERMEKEVFKIIKGTYGTAAVSTKGRYSYLVYDVINKKYKWRFSYGSVDDEKGITKNYTFIMLPRM